jgi:hypothetical protein
MKKGFFDDEKGNRSMMRLLAFITLSTGVVLLISETSFKMFVSVSYKPDTVTALTLIGMGLTAKWAQKKDEK